MKQFIFLILVALVTTGGVLGQRLETDIKVRRPDFSGKWLFNYEESGPESSKIPILAKIKVKIFLTIKQDLPKITFISSSEPEMAELPSGSADLYTDGRGFDLFPDMSGRKFSTTIEWENGKLVKRIFDKSNKLTTRGEIELFANGKKLRLYHWNLDSFGSIYEGFDIFDRVK